MIVASEIEIKTEVDVSEDDNLTRTLEKLSKSSHIDGHITRKNGRKRKTGPKKK